MFAAALVYGFAATEPAACDTYRKVTNGACAQACLSDTIGICPRALVVKGGGLDEGTCEAVGYTVADGTLSQKAGPCGTIDFSKFQKKAATELEWRMPEPTVEAADGPCCKSCTPPLEKYFSVDVPHGFCGEACMDPSKFKIFKFFEKNLTKATDNTPCPEQFTPTGGHYTKYSSTVTHGIPHILAVTLDLYAPDADSK